MLCRHHYLLVDGVRCHIARSQYIKISHQYGIEFINRNILLKFIQFEVATIK